MTGSTHFLSGKDLKGKSSTTAADYAIKNVAGMKCVEIRGLHLGQSLACSLDWLGLSTHTIHSILALDKMRTFANRFKIASFTLRQGSMVRQTREAAGSRQPLPFERAKKVG